MTTKLSGEPNWVQIKNDLSQEFGKDEVKSYTQKGQTLTYIDARSVMNRLDSVVNPQHWNDTYRLVDANDMAVECTLTIHGVSKSDIGYPNSKVGTVSSKTNKLIEEEPLKSAYSDAFKRAAVKWGVGRHLYGSKPEHDFAPASSELQQVQAILRGDSDKKNVVKEYIKANHPKEIKILGDLADVNNSVLVGALEAAKNG